MALKYSDELIGRIKAACAAGIPTKVVAIHSGIPYYTIRRILEGSRRIDVPLDGNFTSMLKGILKG